MRNRPFSQSTGRTLTRLRIRPAIFIKFDPDETRQDGRRDNAAAMNALSLRLRPPLNGPDPAQPELSAAHGITWSVGLGSLFWAVVLFVWLG